MQTSVCGETHQLLTCWTWKRMKVSSIEMISHCYSLVGICCLVSSTYQSATASGDIRHIVKTVENLPNNVSQQIAITINDKEFDVVARNTILLLALTAETTADVGTSSLSDCVNILIHIWYSALIPTRALSWLNDNVKPLIDQVCSQTSTFRQTLFWRRLGSSYMGALFALFWQRSTGFSFKPF